MQALRFILGIRWKDHISNLEVLDQVHQHRGYHHQGPTSMGWTRDSNGGVSDAGKINQGRPKLRYKDTDKANLRWCYINPRDLEGYAMDRPKWRGSAHIAAANFEEVRCQKLTAARERYHRATSAVFTTTDFQCPHCSRLCAPGLGLRSHLRVHR